jgi:hypothetical protein
MGDGMNDSSLGGNRTDDLSSGGAGYGGMNNDEFTNTAGRDEFSSGNRDEFGTGNREHGKASMGDKVKGSFPLPYYRCSKPDHDLFRRRREARG